MPGTAAGGRNRVLQAAKARERYADISGAAFTPVVALSWPVEHIPEFLRFCGLAKWTKQRGDDTVVGQFVKKNRLKVLATVPCLVEHPDLEPSLIRGRDFGGRQPNRKAALFTG